MGSSFGSVLSCGAAPPGRLLEEPSSDECWTGASRRELPQPSETLRNRPHSPAMGPRKGSPDVFSHRTIRLCFRSAAIAEAVSWVGMLTAMAIKYPLQGSPIWVSIWGWVHGILWIAFVLACLAAAFRFRWSWWVTLIGLATSTLPFLTVPFDRWMERSGRLGARPARTTAVAAT